MNARVLVGTLTGLATVTLVDAIGFYLIASVLMNNMDQILDAWALTSKMIFLHQF